MCTDNNGTELLANKKPMLDTPEMIEDLKRKGIKFGFMSEADAAEFLEQNTNYFKLRAYRKNFETASSGPRKGQYLDLDFAALRDLSTLDMRLRYILIHMCLDIEHSIKVRIIRTVQRYDKTDAYEMVDAYIGDMQTRRFSDPNADDYQRGLFNIKKDDVYRRDLAEKYKESCPVWVLSEIVHFGELLELYAFAQCRYVCCECETSQQKQLPEICTRISTDKQGAFRAYKLANTKNSLPLCPRIRKIEQDDRLLQDVRRIRNASAHNSCILNDLRVPNGSGTEDGTASPILMNALQGILPELQARIPKITSKGINKMMKNLRIRQCLSTIYAHKLYVGSSSMVDHRWNELKELTNVRMYKHPEYYTRCTPVVNFFEFLRETVDIWGKSE